MNRLRAEDMEENTNPGPFRRIFLRRKGILAYISPGLLVVSLISIFRFGMFGIIITIIFGFVQDWANNEELFAWINKLLQNDLN
tara:strand:- start:31 stop:282 length:252 start_codon:yes stop_codon:yes gene_type:complete